MTSNLLPTLLHPIRSGSSRSDQFLLLNDLLSNHREGVPVLFSADQCRSFGIMLVNIDDSEIGMEQPLKIGACMDRQITPPHPGPGIPFAHEMATEYATSPQ